MRSEKQYIGAEYVQRLNASPFFIVVDYRGLTVGHFTELRRRLVKAGAEVHVVKNSIFRIAAKESRTTDLAGSLAGQLAIVTGQRDISGAAKVLKTFQSEFEKPKVKFGYLNNDRLETKDLQALAELPSLKVLRARLLGVFQAPAPRRARLLNTPGRKQARALQARRQRGEKAEHNG